MAGKPVLLVLLVGAQGAAAVLVTLGQLALWAAVRGVAEQDLRDPPACKALRVQLQDQQARLDCKALQVQLQDQQARLDCKALRVQ